MRPYDSSLWRSLPRDGECAIHALTGAPCSGPLHLHHLDPVSEGGDFHGRTVLLCRRHHPTAEALGRRLRRWKRCRHRHTSAEARAQCERVLNAA